MVTPLDTSGGNSAAKAQQAFAAFFCIERWRFKRLS